MGNKPSDASGGKHGSKEPKADNNQQQTSQQGSEKGGAANNNGVPPSSAEKQSGNSNPTSANSSSNNNGATTSNQKEGCMSACLSSEKRRHGANLNSSLTPDDFELLQVVGKGSFGKVFQVRKKDSGKIYAMKVLKKEQLLKRKQVAHTQTERRVLEEIDHPFVVSLRFAFQTQDKLYMVLDYFSGGELFFHLKANGRFSEELTRFYAAEIILALDCLHTNTIVYRDLKPENVLLDEEGHIRLTDFGLSKESISGAVLTHTFCGTPEYLAPEIISGAGYNKSVDWWSQGTLLYEMITGLPPFFNTNVHAMYEKIMRGTLTFPSYVSPDAQSFLTGLLQRNPTQRLGGGPGDAEEVKAHPFFAGLNWDDVYNKKVVPPFKPFTKDGATDTSNIDEEFKREVVADTPMQNNGLKARVNFPDFSYQAPESNLGQQEEDEIQK